MARTRASGFSLLELMLVVSVMTIVVALAVPAVLAGLEHARTAGAARYVAGRLALARMEAVKRTAAVGWRFERAGADVQYAMYVDGNGNGIRTADIRSGRDRLLIPAERLADKFSGVRFGLVEGVPLVDESQPRTEDDNPVRIGAAGILTFTPHGTATPGTLYLKGRDNRQFAVRVLGTTGRTRVLEFNVGSRRWMQR
jgi:prepilin-type N-terminal cleavage/methylation domain-containing protein